MILSITGLIPPNNSRKTSLDPFSKFAQGPNLVEVEFFGLIVLVSIKGPSLTKGYTNQKVYNPKVIQPKGLQPKGLQPRSYKLKTPANTKMVPLFCKKCLKQFLVDTGPGSYFCCACEEDEKLIQQQNQSRLHSTMSEESKGRGRPIPDANISRKVFKRIWYEIERALSLEKKYKSNLLVTHLDQQPDVVALPSRDGAVHILRCLKVWFDLPSVVFLTSVNVLDRFLSKMKVSLNQ